MATAMKALNYPKAGAVKVGCRTSGAAFQCKATYRHHRVRRFYAEWASAWGDRGGFICAGAKLSACKTLRHGFVPSYEVQRLGGPDVGAYEVSRGYMDIHSNDPEPQIAANCVQPTKPSTWSFCYARNNGNINVAVHMGHANGGYVTTATETLY
jgi:hypothetical protein